jgi:hypothetical protein
MAIDNVLNEAWNVYRRFFKQFFLTAFIVFVVLDLLTAIADDAAQHGSNGAILLWSTVAAVIGLIGYFWVQAALVELVHDVRDGRADRSIGETYRAVQPRLPSVIGAAVLAGLGIGIGLLLLLVPGLYLLTIWALIVPVIVIEGRPVMESFGRSREIVRGNGWSMFALVLIAFIGTAIVANLITLVFKPLPDFLDVWLGSLVAHSLTVPFAAAVLTTAYFQLTSGGDVAPEPLDPAPL